MNNNNNILENLKARLMLAADFRHILFVKDPNLGFGYVALDVEGVAPSTITRVEYYSASNLKFFKVVEPLVQAIYGKKCKNISSISNVNVIASYQPEIKSDKSKVLINKNFPADIMSLDETDNQGLTFREFVFNSCMKFKDADGNLSIGVELEDYTGKVNSIKQNLQKNDLTSHKPWDGIDPAKHKEFTPDVPLNLQLATKKRKEYKRALAHVTTITPTELSNNIDFQGPAGGGKTTMVETLALDLDLPYASITGAPDLDKDDPWGSTVPNTDPNVSSTWAQLFTNFFICARVGGICEYGELPATAPSFQLSNTNTVYGNNRVIIFQGKTYPVHPKTIFVVTRNIGYQGQQDMNEAFKERFHPVFCETIPCDLYAEYQAGEWEPYGIDKDTTVSYVKFMYELIDYMQDNLKNMDQFSVATPSICTRDIPRVLKGTIDKTSLAEELYETLMGKLSGVEDPKNIIAGIIAKFAKEISDIEAKLFMDTAIVNEAKQDLKDLYGCFVSSIQSSGSKTNNASSIFESFDSADTDSILNTLKTGGFNV
jgi:hypothetical protein